MGKEIKELKINNVIHAEYILEGNHIYIKVLVKIIEDDEGETEEFFIDIIGQIERVEIKFASFLNIKK